MTRASLLADLVPIFKAEGRIVIVGASLAGLRAAEALRDEGFRGPLTIIGDEPHEPYDRPPLSKQVLTGWVPADHTKLPRTRAVDADWRLGVAATGLDRANKQVLLANGDTVHPVGVEKTLLAHRGPEILLAVDNVKTLADEEMKVTLDETGHLKRITKLMDPATAASKFFTHLLVDKRD